MKREEEIVNASIIYSEYEYNQIDFKNGFFTGAKWADENPKSSWISIKDDLPCNHDSLLISYLPYSNTLTKPVLTLVDDGSYQVCEMFINGEGKWEWSYNGTVICWFPIPELPKDKNSR